MLEIDTGICLKKTKKMKNMENNTEKIYLKNTWKNTWKNTEKNNPRMCWRIVRKRIISI